MIVRITDDDAPEHKFVNLANASRVYINPTEGVRVWFGGVESEFYTGREGERISKAIESLWIKSASFSKTFSMNNADWDENKECFVEG